MVLADEVHYRDGGAWDGLADGKGSSLERIDPRADGRLAPNWAASDESLRAGWTPGRLARPFRLARGPI